jgi:putative addiction module component (TIGR02574 family)
MDLELERIFEQAVRLPRSDQEVLARWLIESLDGPPDLEAERKWDEEADLRQQELEDGRVSPISSETLRERILGDSPGPWRQKS